MDFAALFTAMGDVDFFKTSVLVFFLYSFVGYVWECFVLTIESKRAVFNRGFTPHLPFCIIYGFGGLICYFMFSPLQANPLLIYIIGALAATCFEFIVAKMQLRLFGEFWWNYAHKPLNYKGIVCLESTLFWGVLALAIVYYLHNIALGVVTLIPTRIQGYLAVMLPLAYALDFIFATRQAYHSKQAGASPSPEEAGLL